MRIAFQTGYRNNLVDIERTNADLAKYQQQISSGKRLEVPSDDPTAAVGAVKEHTEIATLDQYTQSADSANSRLTVIDTVLSDVINKLTQAQATTASAMGNTATAQQRVSAADDLAGIRDSLYASFNTMFRGTYLLAAGTDTTHAPYVQNPDGSIGAVSGRHDDAVGRCEPSEGGAGHVQRRCDHSRRGCDGRVWRAAEPDRGRPVRQSGQHADGDGRAEACVRPRHQHAIKVGTDENAVADEQSRLDAMRRASAARLSSDEDTNMAAAITNLSAADTAHKAALGAAATINKLHAAGLPVMPQSAHATKDAPRRRVETNVGTFDVAAADTIQFPDGLPGFERCRRFIVISSDDIAPLHCLHAVDGPSASFLAVDPRVVMPTYRCMLGDSDRVKLGVTDDAAPLVWLALVTVDAGQGPSVNLRAPVVINPARMLGCQVMPHDSLYPLRHPLTAE